MMKTRVLLGVFLLCVVALLAASYAALPKILTIVAEKALAQAGFSGSSVRVSSVGPTHLALSNLTIAATPPWHAAKIEIEFSPGRLAAGIIDGITITAPKVSIDLSATGVGLGPFDALLEGDGANSFWRLIGPLRVTDADASMNTPFGNIAASLDGHITLTDGLGTETDARFSLVHPQAVLSGHWDGVIGEDGVGRLMFDISDARSAARVAFSKLSGRVELTGRFPDGMAGSGQLTLQDVIADGLPLGNLDLGASLKDGAATATFLAGGDALGVALDATARAPNVFDPNGLVDLSGNVATDGFRGRLEEVSPLSVLGSVGFSLQGSRSALQGLLDNLAEGDVSAPSMVSGWLEASQLGLRLLDDEADAQVDGLLDVSVGPMGWELDPVGDVTIDMNAAVEGERRSILAAIGAVDDTVFARGEPDLTAPVRMAGTFDTLWDGHTHLTGDFGGNAWVADTLHLEEMAVRLNPLGVQTGELDVVIDAATLRLNGALPSLTTALVLEARLSGKVSPGVRVDGGQLSVVGDLTYQGKQVQLRSDACINARVARFVMDATEVSSGPIRVCPQRNGRPMVDLTFADDASTLVALNADIPQVEIADLQIDGYTVSGVLPRLSGSLNLDITRKTWWTDVSMVGGEMRAEAINVSIADVEGQITAEGQHRLVGLQLDLEQARLREVGRPQRIAPLTLSGKAALASDTLSFDGEAQLGPGPMFAVESRHRLRDGRGWLSAELPPWQMIEDTPSIEDIIPALRGVATSASGEVAASARFDWSDRGLVSKGRLSLSEVGVDLDAARLVGANVDVDLSSLWPAKTDGEQVLRIATVDPGIPFNWGEIRFEMPGDGTLVVDEAAWPLAGGRVRFRNIAVPFDATPDRLIADLVGMNAATMADLLDIDGFEVDGLIDGVIPISMTEAGAVIDNARLVAQSGGRLSYRSPNADSVLAASGGSTEILARALEDFRYTDLELRVNGPLAGDLTASAQIKGANPALYDGKRIELNVQLSGALRELLQSASVLNNVPDVVRDRVQDPAGTPKRTQ